MRITRLGHIFSAEAGPGWMVSHAAYPTPVVLSQDRIRVFFNARDAENRGHLGWIDVDAEDPRRILQVAQAPALGLGFLGAFDDRGIANGSILNIGDQLRLYYMGWNKAADVLFRNAIGLAISRDVQGTTFDRAFIGPLIDRSRFDPFTVTYPFVVPGKAGADWRMFYGSSRAGGDREDNVDHVITEATSPDGVDWRPTGRDVIGLAEGEFAITRPWRLDSDGQAYLFYSIRRQNYTIGLARLDPLTGLWGRVTDDLLGPSRDAWESESTCYAATVWAAGRCYLFYCGNGYGRTGFGAAAIEI